MAKKTARKTAKKTTRATARRRKKTIPRAQMLQRYARLYSGPIYDVMEAMGLPNQVLNHEIRPLARGMKIAGPALTQQSIDAPPGTIQYSGNHFDKLRAACKRGCVIVYAMGQEQYSGHWGELTSTIVKAAGCQGVVIDGGARDSDLQERMGFQVFCRFTSPIEAGTRISLMQIQTPVFMPGSLTTHVAVHPGDWVFGDGDGVTIIPRDVAVEVLVKAEEVCEREAKGRELFASGVDPMEVVRKYHVG